LSYCDVSGWKILEKLIAREITDEGSDQLLFAVDLAYDVINF